MSRLRSRTSLIQPAGLAGLALLGAAAGCTEASSPTELNPEGPPMVMQMFMLERVTTGTITREVTGLAFGDHPDFPAEDDRQVTNAVVFSPASQRLRVVVDELLVGNYLEEIACRDGSYQRVPVGSTPDDIANCSVQDDVLASTCVGEYAVCIGPNGPIGVLDEDENGSADDTRFIQGAARIDCGDGLEVPLSLSGSFWQPSGNQQVPAAGGFNALGPAVILQPGGLGLPTGSDCSVTFADTIVDKSGNRLCAPPDGDITQDCEPGDTSLLTFRTEAFAIKGSVPQNNQTNVGLRISTSNDNARMILQFNVALVQVDGAGNLPADAFTLLEGDTDITSEVVATRDAAPAVNQVTLLLPGGFQPSTTYTLTVGEGMRDPFGLPFPAGDAASITWTTISN